MEHFFRASDGKEFTDASACELHEAEIVEITTFRAALVAAGYDDLTVKRAMAVVALFTRHIDGVAIPAPVKRPRKAKAEAKVELKAA
jgi:hypothetical protein